MADEVENEETEETEDEEFPDDDVELLEDDEDDPLVEDDDALIVIDDDALVADDDEDEVELPVVDLAEKGKESKARPAAAAVEPDEEDDDDEDDADVEASLDVILKERLVVEDDETDDDDEKGHVAEHDHGDTNRKVPPRRPDEFVCQSCFLVKHPSQLADKKTQLCLDCE